MAANGAAIELTGYWQLRKAEGLDAFLKDLGFPWVIRKAALKFGSSSIDVVSQAGPEVKVTSLNAKGSWTRLYDTTREVQQRNPEGALCTTRSWWEGPVLRSRTEGSPLGPCESWRYVRGDSMIVRTCVSLASGKGEASMYWLFDRHKVLERHLGAGGRAALKKQIAADQKRVQQATQKDNHYLQALLLDWERWKSPADEFIHVVSPSYVHSRPRLRSGVTPGGSPRALSPAPMSKSASAASLSALEGRSAAALQQQLPPGQPTSSSDLAGAGEEGGGASGSRGPSRFTREISLAYHEDPSLGGAEPGGSQSQLPSGRAPSPLPEGGNGRGTPPPVPGHRHTASGEGLPIGRAGPGHRKAASLDSRSGLSPSDGRSTPARATPRSTPTQHAVPTGGEALLVYKLQEFRDGRGISAVVPVLTPNDTSEPQLLGMSPEQAEETAAKLGELEGDMLLRRQEGSAGVTCCGLVIARANASLPDWLRVWESSMLI